MDYFTSTFQDYQPIFVGAGCLAVGYIFGRHCRSVIENQVGVPTSSDAPCCAQSESNYVSNHADREPMAVMHPTSCPIDLALNYSDREIAKKPERCGKRDLGQLEIFDPHDLHRVPRKKEEVLWAQTGAFKKQKGIPVRRESIQTKRETEQDSDDEILARRLEYFTKSASGTRASINKPGGSNVLKLTKRKKATADVTTSCEAKRGKDITTDSQKSLSKGTTRSLSGLGALAASLHDQGECSPEDTCRSPKTVCLGYAEEKDEGHCQVGLGYAGEKDEGNCEVEHTNFAPQTETVTVPCAKSSTFFSVKYTLSNPLEVYIGDDMSLDTGINSAGLMDSQCELNESDNSSDHAMVENEEDDRPDARMEDIAGEGDSTVLLQSREEKQLDLPTSPPPELHVQDRCLVEEREVKEEHAVPMDKVLKVSFEEIVSLLEEKLKVELREDKAHIVSLVREVISISKLLEEEKALEGSEQV